MKTVRLAVCLLSIVNSSVLGDDVPRPPTKAAGFEQRLFKDADGGTLHYWMLVPPGFDPSAETKYPLVLCLHGRGGNTSAAGVLALKEMQKANPCIVVAPAVTRAERWAMPKSMNLLPGRNALPRALALVDSLKKTLPVEEDRVYVTGQSMGGFGSFGAIAARPDLFAAAVPICGGWDPAEAKTFAQVPVWAFHGDKDRTVPPERTANVVEAMKAAGGSPKHTVYPGVGHNSWSRTYDSAETWKWLFAQRRAKPESP